MRRLRIVIAALMLAVLLASAFTGVSLAQNPNEDCPAGTTLVAKFEWQGAAGYVFEKPAGNDDVVTITGDETGGTWESLFGIAYVNLLRNRVSRLVLEVGILSDSLMSRL